MSMNDLTNILSHETPSVVLRVDRGHEAPKGVQVGLSWTNEVFDYIFSSRMSAENIEKFLEDSSSASYEAFVFNQMRKSL